MIVEVDSVREAISLFTGLDFEPADIGSYPIPHEKVKSFLWCSNRRAAGRAPYVHAVWIEADDTIHIETDRLGNTSDMTEAFYGEQSLHEFVNMDLRGFEKAKVRNEYGQRFPRVTERLASYKSLVAEISRRRLVPLALLFHGSKGLASFRVEAKIGTGQTVTMPLQKVIGEAVNALQEAYYEIARRQRTLHEHGQ